MRTVGNTFVRATDQTAVVQAVIRAFGGDPARSSPETDRLRRQLGPYQPIITAGGPATADQAAFNHIISTSFSDIMPAVYVSPSLNGWVGVFDRSLEGADDPQPDLALALSRELQTVAVSFWLFQSDLFRYFAAKNGTLLDEYMYFPTAQDREELAFLTGRSMAGDPGLLAWLCQQPEAEEVMEQLLSDDNLTPMDLLGGIASAVGIHLWPFSHQHLIDQPTLDLPACWHWFESVTQGQLHYLPAPELRP